MRGLRGRGRARWNADSVWRYDVDIETESQSHPSPPDHLESLRVIEDDISQADADELCTAASAVFFALLRVEAARHHSAIALPELLCPTSRLPAPEDLAPDLLERATAMLLRLQVVEIDDHGKLRVHLVRNG